jgi:hypothetical protein
MNGFRKTSSYHLATKLALFLVLLISGCNLPSKSESPIQASAQPEETSLPLPSPTPVEPPQAVTMTSALTSGVENGSWTLEEGLLNGLRFLAGEISSEEAFGDVELISTEGTGLIDSAQRYLFEGADEQAKTEIQHYLEMLMPSPETLDKYSRPAEKSSGIAHLARTTNRPDEDEFTCQNMWANSFSTPTPIICTILDEQTVRGTNIRLYYPEYWTEADPRLDSMGVIMDAAQRSVEQYNGYGPDPINTVYMVYTDLPYRETSTSRFESDVFAAAYNADFSNPTGRLLSSTCRIGIFPHGLEGSPESLEQTIAHEMFHCYQYKNLREQTLNLPNAIIDWWKEGSAEFFGATVYPDNNDEFQFNSNFRASVAHDPLMGMSYENYLFFQYLGMQGGFGDEGVVNVLRSMPVSGSVIDQRDALAGISGMSELFHNFTRDYVDKRLQDWGGGVLSIEPIIDDQRSFGEGFTNETFTPRSFFLGIYQVTFEDQTKFNNTVEERGETGKYSIRPSDFVGAWQGFPLRLNTVCEPNDYIMVVTRAQTSGADPYEVGIQANGVHEESRTCDECLYGTWELDTGSDFYYLSSLVDIGTSLGPSFGADTSLGDVWMEGVSGQMLISFTEDGIAKGTQADYTWTSKAIEYRTGEIMTITSIFNGGGSAEYTLQETPEEEKWIFFSDGEFGISEDLYYNGRLITTIPYNQSNASIFLASSAQYECNEDTLLYTAMPGYGTLIFHRVPPPSETP